MKAKEPRAARPGRSRNESDRFQALADRQAAFEAKGGISRNGPLYRYVARQTLQDLRWRLEAGDTYALMLAVRVCAQHDLVMPQWLATAYIRAFDGVHNYREKSWDAAFGAPLPKGAHLNALRGRRLLYWKIRSRVNALKAARERIDWEALAREFTSNTSTLQDLYYRRIARRPGKIPKKT